MKTKILAIAAVVVLALVASAVAADVTGKWVAKQEGRNGTTETTFDLKADGVKVTGTVTMPGMMGGEPTKVEIKDGKIDADNVSFVVVRMVGPNQDMEMKSTYKGKIAGDEITFTVERAPMPGMGGPGGGAPGGGGGMGPGGPGGGAPGGGAPRPPLVAKRVK